MLKTGTYNYDSAPVKIINEIKAPAVTEPETADENPEEEISPEELEERRKEEEKQRISLMIDERVEEIISAHRETVNAESNAIITSAKAEAAALSEKAKNAAAEMLKNAKEESEKLCEAAKKQGYSDGFASGRADAEDKCAAYLDAVGRFLEEINSKKEAYYISNEKELRQTVIETVEKIILAKLKEDDKIVERIVSEAAKNFRNSDFLKISVRGSEVSKEFRSDKEYVKNAACGIPDIEVEYLPEDEYPEGTVILDNDSEILDASVPTQLEFLREIMGRSGSDEE